MIVAGDLDSAELRIVSTLAQDKPFLECFQNGIKPHYGTCEALFGNRFDSGTPEYKFSKSFTYQWIYTLPDKVPSDTGKLRLYTVGLTADRLVQLTHVMDKTHPAIVRDKRTAIADLHKTHLVRNVFGRYRDLSWGLFVWDKGVVEHVEQAALNFRVQTVIGKIINRAFLKLDEECDELRSGGFQGYPVIQCHDELCMYTPDPNEVDICAKMIKSAIEQPVPEMNMLVIPAELKVGPTWGKMEAYK